MKKIVALTGAGISVESGLSTFRDSGGLWEGHDVTEVASPEGWERDSENVLRFYNERRHQARNAQPNNAHFVLAKLEEFYDVSVVTQNVDDLHEKAGSTKVLHLHGSLFKARSTVDESYVIDIEGDIDIGDHCPKGGQLRPHIVWFGESVPAMYEAAAIASDADIFMVIGTSMVVYPAAGLIQSVPSNARVYVVDPHRPEIYSHHLNVHFITKAAGSGMDDLWSILVESLD